MVTNPKKNFKKNFSRFQNKNYKNIELGGNNYNQGNSHSKKNPKEKVTKDIRKKMIRKRISFLVILDTTIIIVIGKITLKRNACLENKIRRRRKIRMKLII